MRTISSRLGIVALLSAACVPCVIAQQSGEGGETPHWREPARIELTLHGGSSDKSTKWVALFGNRGDFSLAVTEKTADGEENGEILLISGQAMVVQNLSLESGYEIDAIDMPAFHFQLLYGILEHLFPEGPSAVSGEKPVELSESTKSIEVGTASAAGEFAAPWFVKGTVTAQDKNRIVFDVTFTFTVDPAEAMTFPLHLSGSWTGGAPESGIADDFSIAGWSVYSIGPTEVETEKGTATEFSAQPTGKSFQTVGELRSEIARTEAGPETE